MKPLVYYCRWQNVSLRLRGRSKTAVWGHLVQTDENNNERQQEFSFNLQTWELTLKESEADDSTNQIIKLDEMGVAV